MASRSVPFRRLLRSRFLLLGLLPLALLGTIAGLWFSGMVRQAALDLEQTHLRYLSDRLLDHLGQVGDDASHVAAFLDASQGNRAGAGAFASRLMARNPLLEAFLLLDPRGRVDACWPPSPSLVGNDLSRLVRELGPPSRTMDVRRSPLSGNPSVLVAEPWAGGLVVAVVEAATLSQGLQAAGSRVQVILTDRFGNLVAHPDVHRVLAGDNIADTPLFQGWENRAGRPWSVSRPGGADQVLVQTVAGPGWPLFLLLDQGTLLEPVLRLWAVVLGLFFATGFLVWWWSARQSRLVVDPVARLWTWARSVGQGRYEDPLPRVDIDELEGLNQAFREMVRAVSDRETTIQNWNAELEEKVADRTRLWEEANEELSAMNVELSRTNIELEASFHNLETAQGKLVQAEKKAVYVHLAASLSHELNTPLGAILSSQGSLDHFLERQFPGLLEAYARWTPATRTWFRDLASLALTEGPGVSERDLRRTWLALPGTAVHPLADALAELGVGPSQVVVPPGAEAEEAVHQALWAVRTVRVGRVIQEAGLRASQVLVALEQSLPHEGPSRAPNVSGTGRP